MRGNFGFRQQHIRHDNHNVARLHQPRRRAVQAHDAAAALACDGVGFKTRAVVVVHDLHFFVHADARRVQQVLVDGDAANVVQVGLGYGGAVDFAAEQGSKHDVYSKFERRGLYAVNGFQAAFAHGAACVA